MTGTSILGAGMSGLGAALVSGAPVYEASRHCGGACHSYYREVEGVPGRFRFEPAGGHWLFGVSPAALERLRRFGEFSSHKRRAAVYFPESGELVPYPLQENLRCFEPALRQRILDEIETSRPPEPGSTFEDWLLASFGPTLCERFFVPFNRFYTADQLRSIVPQDLYKSPVDRERVRQGVFEPVPDRGYNNVFRYPVGGLDRLVCEMSDGLDVRFSHRVVGVDPAARRVHFGNGRELRYDRLISTLPLDRMAAMCELRGKQPPDPATSVLVVNVAAVRGRRCPPQHWVYVPRSESGFHRVGFYSHVDPSFLPEFDGAASPFVSLYAERSFRSGDAAPDRATLEAAARAIVEELQRWEFIGDAFIVDPTFTDPAYTWSRPGSTWAADTLRELASHGIQQIGRYGAWRFQGMVASFEEGIAAGNLAAA